MRKFIFYALFMCLFFVFATSSFAEVPNEIRYNGRLKSYQTPVNGSTNMTFKLYDSETGGNSLWTSNTVSVNVTSGIFTYILKPTGVDWKKRDIWLEITVSNTILQPREKLMAQAYAFQARAADNGTPPGTIIAYAGKTAPHGYLLCDGRTVATSDYPELYQAIETIYGGNSTNFKLPDLRGMFLRGEGGNSAAIGTQQGDAIRNIFGYVPMVMSIAVETSGAFKNLGSLNMKVGSGSSHGAFGVEFSAANIVPTANENRPINYSVKYCIKY